MQPLNFKDLKKVGNEYKTNCPQCGGQGKLYINFHIRVWHCFKCGKAGRFRPDLISAVPAMPEKPKTVEPLPPGSPIEFNPRVREYFDKVRKIKPYDDWYYCSTGKYANRVILPVVFNGVYRGFQGRSLDPNESFRYLTGDGTKTGKILWGLDYSLTQFSYKKTCFLTEGIFGSCRIHEMGFPSVCSFTKRISSIQAAGFAAKYRQAIIAYDRDALSMALHAGFQLFAYGVTVAVLLMKKKGPDDHSLEELRQLEVVPLFDLEERISRGTVRLDQTPI